MIGVMVVAFSVNTLVIIVGGLVFFLGLLMVWPAPVGSVLDAFRGFFDGLRQGRLFKSYEPGTTENVRDDGEEPMVVLNKTGARAPRGTRIKQGAFPHYEIGEHEIELQRKLAKLRSLITPVDPSKRTPTRKQN